MSGINCDPLLSPTISAFFGFVTCDLHLVRIGDGELLQILSSTFDGCHPQGDQKEGVGQVEVPRGVLQGSLRIDNDLSAIEGGLCEG